MESRQKLLLESIRKALITLRARAFQTPRLIRLRLQLQAAHDEIIALAQTQARGVDTEWYRESTDKLRVLLRESHLLAISNDAPLLLDGMPGIADEFRVPHKRAPDEELLKATDRILRNAERYKEAFIDGRWKEDFIDRARDAAEALEIKLAEGNPRLNRRSRATHSLPAAIAKGREIMRSIDRIVVAELGKDAAWASQWKAAFRVPKKLGRPKKKGRDDLPPSVDGT
jgi:hypothetical protein